MMPGFTRLRGGNALPFALAAALTALGVAAPATATVDAAVRDALALHASGKAEAAYAMLAPLEKSRAGDPDFDYALGLAAADSGHTGQAIIALQRVIAVQPDNAPARAEIARAYAQSGDIDTARAQFDTVVNDPSVPDPVRQRLDRLIRGYDRQIAGGGRDLSGFADAEGGYDSNINAATSLGSITLPVFAFLGPASLNGAARRQDDGYSQLQGGLSAGTGLSRQTRGFASILGSWRDNASSRAFDQTALTGTVGISHTTASRDVLALSGQAQLFWLGRDAYRNSYGVTGQYTHRLAGDRAVFVSAQYFRLDYRQDDLRDANRYVASLGYAGKFVIATLGGGRERTVRSAAVHQSFGFGTASLAAEVPVGSAVAVVVGASLEYRDYDKTDPLFLAGRRDTQADASLGLRIALAKGFSVRPRVAYTRNFSNLDVYDYRRVTAAVGVRAEF